MELQNRNGATVQNETAKETISNAAQNGAAKKEAANGKPVAEKPKQSPPTAEKPEDKREQPKTEEPKEAPKPVTEQSKDESIPAKTVMNLEAKLKAVDDLHRRSIQRLNLIARIRQLEAFQVALAQENDELEDNPYQGCRLIIKDDKNREFVTTTPGLIRLVSQFIFDACTVKLGEIESAIVFPGA